MPQKRLFSIVWCVVSGGVAVCMKHSGNKWEVLGVARSASEMLELTAVYGQPKGALVLSAVRSMFGR
jgi:hypothetical protein